MSARSKRNWGIAVIVFFLIMLFGIGFSEWWAYHVNVPAYEHAKGGSVR